MPLRAKQYKGWKAYGDATYPGRLYLTIDAEAKYQMLRLAGTGHEHDDPIHVVTLNNEYKAYEAERRNRLRRGKAPELRPTSHVLAPTRIQSSTQHSPHATASRNEAIRADEVSVVSRPHFATTLPPNAHLTDLASPTHHVHEQHQATQQLNNNAQAHKIALTHPPRRLIRTTDIHQASGQRSAQHGANEEPSSSGGRFASQRAKSHHDRKSITSLYGRPQRTSFTAQKASGKSTRHSATDHYLPGAPGHAGPSIPPTSPTISGFTVGPNFVQPPHLAPAPNFRTDFNLFEPQGVAASIASSHSIQEQAYPMRHERVFHQGASLSGFYPHNITALGPGMLGGQDTQRLARQGEDYQQLATSGPLQAYNDVSPAITLTGSYPVTPITEHGTSRTAVFDHFDVAEGHFATTSHHSKVQLPFFTQPAPVAADQYQHPNSGMAFDSFFVDMALLNEVLDKETESIAREMELVRKNPNLFNFQGQGI